LPPLVCSIVQYSIDPKRFGSSKVFIRQVRVMNRLRDEAQPGIPDTEALYECFKGAVVAT